MHLGQRQYAILHRLDTEGPARSIRALQPEDEKSNWNHYNCVNNLHYRGFIARNPKPRSKSYFFGPQTIEITEAGRRALAGLD